MKELIETSKVAFVGAACTGKTTAFDYYQQRNGTNPRVGFVSEAARAFYQDHPEVVPQYTTKNSLRIQSYVLGREQAAQTADRQLILTDRSVADGIVNTRLNGDRQGADILYDNVQFWLPTYNRFLVFSPEDIPFQRDHVRYETDAVRQRAHDLFIDFFLEKALPFAIIRGTFAARVRNIDAILQEIDPKFNQYTNSPVIL